ncbi:radical SAM protein [Mangrovibacterium lignilyticum]|uniref:radical SAM protein n=1 Tax=Mangrovibacterium lignilyticum TaxID=2668052 RepID=UPI0013D89E04|nr:radical SAM protein [Mangrovibacterium lignilyticum]
MEIARRKYKGNYKLIKLAKVDNRYYWDINIPGYPSIATKSYLEASISRIQPDLIDKNKLSTVIWALTNKCHYNCIHCSEWNTKDSNDALSLNDLKKILNEVQKLGVSQIQFSGGEPLNRIGDIMELLSSARPSTDFWLLTSGCNFTSENAKLLKNAGLTGISISLDHFDPDSHNKYRGSLDAYKWVEEAALNAHREGLVICLAICPTELFISTQNLMNYALLAKKLKASFIRIIEPVAIGHYENKKVELNKFQIKILEDFYLQMNYSAEYIDFPIVSYPGYYQRRIGCFGAGEGYLFIDQEGDLHSCPFCRNSEKMNVVNTPFETQLRLLKERGCQRFKKSVY